jgi:general secretion pathway protein K
MVLGMDEATLKWLEPLITVYSEQSEIDLQLASKGVLQVLLDVNSEVLDRYLLTRAENVRNNLPPPPLPVAGSSSGSASSEVIALTIISEVQLSDQSTAVINALVKKSDGLQSTPFQVVRWQTVNNGSLFADNMNDLVVKHYAESEFNH